MQSLPGSSASTRGSETDSGPPRILSFPGGGHRAAGAFVSPRKILADLTAEISASGGRPAVPVSVTADVPEALQIEADGDLIRRLFMLLLDRSVSAAAGQIQARPSSREVLVTAVAYPERIEIEFADSGSGLTLWERNSLPRGRSTVAPRESTDPLLDDVLRMAVSIGGTLAAIDCPEGGSAVTLSLPIRRAARRWAA